MLVSTGESMKHIRFETKEAWLKWRLTGIGASEAPAVMGDGFISAKNLWELKLGIGKPQFVSSAMRRGIGLQDKALREYSRLKNWMEFREGFFQSEKVPFQLASLDGIDKTFKHAVEIKCPGAEDHSCALKGNIPEHYTWQLAHILMVLDLPEMDYFSFDGEDGVILVYKRDPEKEAALLKAETEFWKSVQSKTAPVSKKFPEITKEMSFKEKLAVVRGGKK